MRPPALARYRQHSYHMGDGRMDEVKCRRCGYTEKNTGSGSEPFREAVVEYEWAVTASGKGSYRSRYEVPAREVFATWREAGWHPELSRAPVHSWEIVEPSRGMIADERLRAGDPGQNQRPVDPVPVQQSVRVALSYYGDEPAFGTGSAEDKAFVEEWLTRYVQTHPPAPSQSVEDLYETVLQIMQSERWTDEQRDADKELLDALIEAVRREQDGLRAALTMIASHHRGMSDWPHSTEMMQTIAQRALDSEQDAEDITRYQNGGRIES